MSCYNCAKSFSIFTKERSCKNCGFAFCSNCLKNKMIIPKSGVEGNVCGACEKVISNPQQIRPPPDALQRRLDFLENPPAPNPITVYTASKSSKKMTNLKRGLSVEDTAIADRLERLQRDRKSSMNIPTEDEMRERLSKLKDQTHVANDSSQNVYQQNLLLNMDKRSDVQKAKDLIEQANAEVELENKMPKPEDELGDRLARLRGHEISPRRPESMEICPKTFLKNPSARELESDQSNENMTDLSKLLDEVAMEAQDEASTALKEFESDKDLQEKFQSIMKQKSQQHEIMNLPASDSEDDEEKSKQVIKGVLSEQRLEEKSKNYDGLELPDVPTFIPSLQTTSRQIQRCLQEEEERELPWCCICNEDAVLRCVEGCDGDLYCRKCFREGHDEFDLTDHKTIAFKSPKK